MKIKILRSAIKDLAAGRVFYDRQTEGVGGYFASCMLAEIDSLVLQAGHHRIVNGLHRIAPPHRYAPISVCDLLQKIR